MKNRWLSLLFGLSVSFFGSASYAAIDLKSWKNYSNLAEQGAICASFAALMESQSLLNEDMGKLWQERRKFSGAVIGKAVMLEFEKDIASKDIEAFIAEYRDWVLSALMATDSSQPADTDKNTLKIGQEKMAQLIKTQCALLFQQGDRQIRKKHPELAYLIAPATKAVKEVPAATDNASLPETAKVADTKPSEPASPEIPKADKIKPLENASLKNKSAENPQEISEEKSAKEAKPFTLALGGGISFTPTLPKSSKSSPRKDANKTPEPDLESEVKIPAPTSAQTPAPTSAQTPAPTPMPTPAPAQSMAETTPRSEAELIKMPEAPPIRPTAPPPIPEEPALIAKAPTPDTKNKAVERSAQKKPQKQKPQQPRKPARPPVLSPAQQNATSLILPVSLQLPELSYSDMPDNQRPASAFYLSFGDFADVAQAKQKMNMLEGRFSKLFSTYRLQIIAHDVLDTSGSKIDISEDTLKTAPAYRLQTNSSLDMTRAEEICTLLWPHNIGCVPKASING